MPILDCAPAAPEASADLADLGPTIRVEVGYDVDGIYAAPAAGSPSERADATIQIADALIDTGSAVNCIDEDLAQQLELPLVDRVVGAGASGAATFNLYLCSVRIAELGYVKYEQFMGVYLKDAGQPHAVVLGRTLLQDMLFVYDGKRGIARLAY
jgi:hypothetical protein